VTILEDPTIEAVFPNNFVKILGIVLPGIADEVVLFPRPLRPTDPNYSLGVYATVWTPVENSYEIGHLGGGSPVGPNESTLSQYQVGIQLLVKDSNSERALAVSSLLNRRIRSVLYRNAQLRVALGELYAIEDGVTERMRRWGIRNQRYLSNDLEGKFVFMSVLDMWIETEVA
jgi:hypothetical protein